MYLTKRLVDKLNDVNNEVILCTNIYDFSTEINLQYIIEAGVHREFIIDELSPNGGNLLSVSTIDYANLSNITTLETTEDDEEEEIDVEVKSVVTETIIDPNLIELIMIPDRSRG